MVRRYYNLPSLTSLAAFEACARHMSIKLASSELNVTPGAVSRQIRGLEEEAGTPLFLRDKDGMHLTPEGEELYAVLARGFSQASEAFHRIRTGQSQSSVTLACSNAIASMWLMPRIGDFWREHPEIALNHLISDVGTERLSRRRENAGVDRRRGRRIQIHVTLHVGKTPSSRCKTLYSSAAHMTKSTVCVDRSRGGSSRSYGARRKSTGHEHRQHA